MSALADAVWLEALYLRDYAYCKTRREFRALITSRYPNEFK